MTEKSITLASLQEGVVYAITLEAKEGEAEAVERILKDLTAPSMAEPGMKLFLPYRAPDNPSLFFVYELYHDAGGRAAHEATPHFQAVIGDLKAKVAKRELAVFMPFP